MKDPQDCTYPQEALCLHDCEQTCQKRSGWRKKQIDDAEEKKTVYSPFIISELWRLSKWKHQINQDQIAILIQAKAASLENASSDTRWGFEQGAHWMAQVMKARGQA